MFPIVRIPQLTNFTSFTIQIYKMSIQLMLLLFVFLCIVFCDSFCLKTKFAILDINQNQVKSRSCHFRGKKKHLEKLDALLTSANLTIKIKQKGFLEDCCESSEPCLLALRDQGFQGGSLLTAAHLSQRQSYSL